MDFCRTSVYGNGPQLKLGKAMLSERTPSKKGSHAHGKLMEVVEVTEFCGITKSWQESVENWMVGWMKLDRGADKLSGLACCFMPTAPATGVATVAAKRLSVVTRHRFESSGVSLAIDSAAESIRVQQKSPGGDHWLI